MPERYNYWPKQRAIFNFTSSSTSGHSPRRARRRASCVCAKNALQPVPGPTATVRAEPKLESAQESGSGAGDQPAKSKSSRATRADAKRRTQSRHASRHGRKQAQVTRGRRMLSARRPLARWRARPPSRPPASPVEPAELDGRCLERPARFLQLTPSWLDCGGEINLFIASSSVGQPVSQSARVSST